MKELTLPADITVYMQKASSFPQGVLQAHQLLREKTSPDMRAFYGISHPGKDGDIMYWAATTELFESELSGKELERFTIARGKYIYIDVPCFMQNPQAIGDAFAQLLHDDRIAPDGCCIEHYIREQDCRCMVRIK